MTHHHLRERWPPAAGAGRPLNDRLWFMPRFVRGFALRGPVELLCVIELAPELSDLGFSLCELCLEVIPLAGRGSVPGHQPTDALIAGDPSSMSARRWCARADLSPHRKPTFVVPRQSARIAGATTGRLMVFVTGAPLLHRNRRQLPVESATSKCRLDYVLEPVRAKWREQR